MIEKRNIGVQLAKGKIGREGFQPTNLKKLPQTRGVALETGIPPGTRILFVETSGCPEGWTKVTAVDGYHLQIGDVANAGDTQDPDSLEHYHEYTSWGEGGGSVATQSEITNTTTPTLTYPSIAYLMCEKL